MIPYPEETRQEALKVFREKGIREACERFHVPKSSIYRWQRKARQRVILESLPNEDHSTAVNSAQESVSFGRNRSDGRMLEKMLVTQALDERDLLVKKITDKIRKAKLVDTKKRNEKRIAGERVTVDEFGRSAQSAWQQIMDLIDRYQRIDSAVVASNAATWIETSYGRFTVAGAISLRNRLRAKGLIYTKGTDFEGLLQSVLESQFNAGIQLADERNKALEKQAEAMRLSILGKDGKTRDDKPLEVVEAYVRENTTELVDPLGAEKRMADMKEKKEKLISELETQIKVSNATTVIEF